MALTGAAAQSSDRAARSDAAVLGALAQAGVAGLAPGELVRRAGLPERTSQAALARLIAAGHARRDGKVRIWAVGTALAAAAEAPTDPAALTRAERSQHETLSRREQAVAARDAQAALRVRRDAVAAQLNRTAGKIDLRSVTDPELAGHASGIRTALNETSRSVAAAQDQAELDRLVLSCRQTLAPAYAELNRRIEAARDLTQQDRASAEVAEAEHQGRRRKLRRDLAAIDRVMDTVERVSRWEYPDSKALRELRILGGRPLAVRFTRTDPPAPNAGWLARRNAAQPKSWWRSTFEADVEVQLHSAQAALRLLRPAREAVLSELERAAPTRQGTRSELPALEGRVLEGVVLGSRTAQTRALPAAAPVQPTVRATRMAPPKTLRAGGRCTRSGCNRPAEQWVSWAGTSPHPQLPQQGAYCSGDRARLTLRRDVQVLPLR